jgi:hypothetical protein
MSVYNSCDSFQVLNKFQFTYIICLIPIIIKKEILWPMPLKKKLKYMHRNATSVVSALPDVRLQTKWICLRVW